MEIVLKDFEKGKVFTERKKADKTSSTAINEKYERGEARIVTEQGAIKLPMLDQMFKNGNYTMMPVYQRRITWDNAKRSRLIESFIINVPIPPIFIYEVDYGKYEVMDGLQRVSAICDFYNDKFKLESLTEWSELNGCVYSQLPEKIREGIDRRQISVITLLKESAKSQEQEQELKRMVFERLNTGGLKLEPQEIRNALYGGKFNDLCKKLSEDTRFRKMWGIPDPTDYEKDVQSEIDTSIDFAEEIAKNKMYRRMYDVELVLRFFAMRHLDDLGQLSQFLDAFLVFGNRKLEEDASFEKKYEALFIEEMDKAYRLFGDKAFCLYTMIRGDLKWSSPQRMVYDPMMLALSTVSFPPIEFDVEKNCKLLETEYKQHPGLFNGKLQSKKDIENRAEFLCTIVNGILGDELC